MTMMKGDPRRNGRFGESKWMKKISGLRKIIPGKGEANPHHKLNQANVRAIRAIARPLSREKAKVIGRVYGISEGYVYHLRSNGPARRWTHI